MIGEPEDFLDFCYDTITNDCYLSEYELYGNYVYNYIVPELTESSYKYQKIINKHFDKINSHWSIEEIESIIKNNPDCDTIAINSIMI